MQLALLLGLPDGDHQDRQGLFRLAVAPGETRLCFADVQPGYNAWIVYEGLISM